MTDLIRVVIAEDHYLVREGTRRLLEATGEVTVVASVDDADALIEVVERLQPDAVIVDIRMPPTHQTEGIDAARQIRSLHEGIGVVVLSQYANAIYAFELFQDGTSGLAYLLKDRIGDVDELLRAVRAVTQGDSVVDPRVVESLFAHRTTLTRSGLDDLTDRELQVLQQLAEGKSNSAIAESLFVSESAVEKHITAILMKLGLRPEDTTINRRVAAVLAFLRNYTDEDPLSAEAEGGLRGP